MDNKFYAVPTIDWEEDRIITETAEKKYRIDKFTKVIGQVTDEVKNCLMQMQLSTDILERKLSNLDSPVYKDEISYINTGINSLDKAIENLYYSPATNKEKKEIEKFMREIIIVRTVDEVKNYLMQIQLSADILERKLTKFHNFISKFYIKSINAGINLLDKKMEKLLFAVRF